MSQAILYFLIWPVVIFMAVRFSCGAYLLSCGHHTYHDGDSVGGAKFELLKKASTVETKAAKSGTYDGHVYYFCSPDCWGVRPIAAGGYGKFNTS